MLLQHAHTGVACSKPASTQYSPSQGSGAGAGSDCALLVQEIVEELMDRFKEQWEPAVENLVRFPFRDAVSLEKLLLLLWLIFNHPCCALAAPVLCACW